MVSVDKGSWEFVCNEGAAESSKESYDEDTDDDDWVRMYEDDYDGRLAFISTFVTAIILLRSLNKMSRQHWQMLFDTGSIRGVAR